MPDTPSDAVVGVIKRLLDAGLTSSFDEAIEDEARAQHIVHSTADVHEGYPGLRRAT